MMANGSSNLPAPPIMVYNRPGLAAITARIGTFASFRAALLNQLAFTPQLAGLRTRASDDYSITLIELWCILADVLTFYQERLANEGYLRTATLRDSVLRLVRLIDYQLRPGLAATAWLAFTLEPGSTVTIPIGNRVQSVPVGNGSPQKYETIESIQADARFNSLAILPAPEIIQPLTAGRQVEWFAPGDDVVSFAATLAPGDRLIAFNPNAIEILTVASVLQAGDRIGVQWVIPPSGNFAQAADGLTTGYGLYKIGRTFRLFGYDAPVTYLTMTQLSAAAQSVRALPAMTPPLRLDLSGFFLDTRYEGIKPGAICLIAAVASDLTTTTTILASVSSLTEAMATRGPVSATATRLTANALSGPSSLPSVAAPTNAPTLTPMLFSGVLNGTYAVMVTFTNGTVESNPSPVSAPITVFISGIHVSSFPASSNPDFTQLNIYAFKYGVSSSFQLVGSIANTPGAVFSIYTDPNSWTTAPPAALSAVNIYELIGPQLRLQPLSFPSSISSCDLYMSGRRNGWNTIEVGRTIVKGVVQPGVTLGVNDLAPGRTVIVTDASGVSAVAGVVVAAELVGDQINITAPADDALTIGNLGINPGGLPITALASPQLNNPVTLTNANLQMQVTIGRQPPQIISLAKGLSGPAPCSVDLTTLANVLMTAIAEANPDAPEFNLTSVLAMSLPNPSCLVVIPGIPNAPVSFAPTAADPDTVVALGLDAANARYLDGIISGPLSGSAPASGSLEIQIGLLPQTEFSFTGANGYFNIGVQLTKEIGSQFGLANMPICLLTTTNQVIWLPSPSQFERPAFLHLTIGPPAGVQNLDIDLDASSATLMGNVANGSQGETVANEIMGDGDASQPFQSFVLRKNPVTFLLGDGPHGAQSSLKVIVGGIEWTEVPSLYDAKPTDRVFVTRVADDGSMTVRTGDGRMGARLPTGAANIIANYRQGVGVAGAVAANMLTSLLDRPNGLKRVTNPIAADGGADPQVIEDARKNAPETVQTFDRAISLQDFEDVAMGTGEVAKANATWVWSGFQKMIFLTVAAQAGNKLSPDGLANLGSALLLRRDPNHQLLIDNYTRVPIVVSATLAVDSRYSASAVKTAAFNALVSELSFDNLQFGQPICISALYAILQGVDGIVSVDISDLNFKSQDPTFRQAHGATDLGSQDRLFILGARPGSTATDPVIPAELAWVEVPVEDLTLTLTGGSGS